MPFLCCLAEPVDFDADVNLFQFHLHRVVGKGAFGKVRVVEHKKSKKVYALKYIEKSRCIKQKAVANIIQERQLLEEVEHPFIVNLRYAFQDDENCFFVLDLMLGGDLRFHLDIRGALGEDAVRFWLAELTSALHYLHNKHIIHRDIKPDNILLDSEGHAHITDFNVAIHYSTSRLHTSIAGSMAYMAPEILLRKGYTWPVDYWSLGVCAWEVMFGKRPFNGKTADHLKELITKDPIKPPDQRLKSCSKEGMSFLWSLLERDPRKRIGCRSLDDGLDDIRGHPWFAGIDWEALEEKKLPPPYVPDAKKANFDISHELDEFLMVERPLTATKRKQGTDLDKLKPERRQMEEQFTNFDFTKPRRISYYPHNQPIMNAKPRPERVSENSAGSGSHTYQSTGHQSETNTMVAGFATFAERSMSTPIPLEEFDQNIAAYGYGYGQPNVNVQGANGYSASGSAGRPKSSSSRMHMPRTPEAVHSR